MRAHHQPQRHATLDPQRARGQLLVLLWPLLARDPVRPSPSQRRHPCCSLVVLAGAGTVTGAGAGTARVGGEEAGLQQQQRQQSARQQRAQSTRALHVSE